MPNGILAGRKAARFWIGSAIAVATALITTLRARRAERDHPARGRFIDVDGVRLHYLEQGTGAAVVLLHGNGTSSEDFRASGLLDQLAAHHRVVAIDRPGYGFSARPRNRVWTPRAQAALLSSAFDRLGLQQPVVAAHSWATLVALTLALDDPGRLRGLVLLSGYYYPTLRPDVALFAPPAIPLVGDVIRYTIAPLVGALLIRPMQRQMFAPMPVADRFRIAMPASLMLRPSQLRASAEEAAFMIPAAAALRRRYAALRVPLTLIAGADDRVATARRHSARLAREVPGATLRVMPRLGHMVHYFAQDAVAAAVTSSLSSIVRPA
jgi:pimeloyl-ACP methyl ester carboxylesterase